MGHVFSAGSDCLHKSNKHQPRNSKKEENIMWLCQQEVTVWCHFCVLVADYRVHVLRYHAKQVGTADLSAWLHEEPPGLPPRPPCTSVALLQLHVHARRVRSRTSAYHMWISWGLIQLKSGWLLPMTKNHRRNKNPQPSFESCFPSVLSPQFGAAGVQCFTAADDRRSFRDGPRHPTNKSALHGRSAGWWVPYKNKCIIM